MKDKWSEVKETIIKYIKFHMLFIFMSLGFWFTYSLVWFGVGLPQTDWALLVTLILAFISEHFYLRWVTK
jgi:hypothetical protein